MTDPNSLVSSQDSSHSNWLSEDGTPNGGQSFGLGYTICWQRGPLDEGKPQNGAFLVTIIKACLSRIAFYQSTKLASGDYQTVAYHLQMAIAVLGQRQCKGGTDRNTRI